SRANAAGHRFHFSTTPDRPSRLRLARNGRLLRCGDPVRYRGFCRRHTVCAAGPAYLHLRANQLTAVASDFMGSPRPLALRAPTQSQRGRSTRARACGPTHGAVKTPAQAEAKTVKISQEFEVPIQLDVRFRRIAYLAPRFCLGAHEIDPGGVLPKGTR